MAKLALIFGIVLCCLFVWNDVREIRTIASIQEYANTMTYINSHDTSPETNNKLVTILADTPLFTEISDPFLAIHEKASLMSRKVRYCHIYKSIRMVNACNNLLGIHLLLFHLTMIHIKKTRIISQKRKKNLLVKQA